MRILSIILLSAMLCLAACQTGPVALSESDMAAIKATSEAFSDAMNAGNLAAVAEAYTEDAVLMPANAPTVEGRASILAFLESFPAISNFKFTLVEIKGMGDMTFVRGTYSMTLTPEGAEPINDTGKFIEIRERQADGSWLISRDIFNSDLAVPH